MKFVLVLLAVLACGSANAASRTLAEDWAEILAIVPLAEIKEIIATYKENDAEVQEIAEFLRSDEFEAMILAVDAEPSFVAILDHLEAQGVPIYDFLNRLHDYLGIPQIPKPMSGAYRSVQKGWRDMWNEIFAILPRDDMYNWHCGKIADAAEWNTLYESLANEDFRAMINALRATDSWQAVVAKLGEYGVQSDLIVAALQRFFNWDGDSIDYCIDFVPRA